MLPVPPTQRVELVEIDQTRNGDGVVPSEDGSQAARDAVLVRMRECGYGSPRQLALASGAGYNAVNEWLKGERHWPRRETRAKIELALGWEPGQLARIAHHSDDLKLTRSADSGIASPETPESPGPVVLGLAPGLLSGFSETEAAEITAAATLAALQRMREIRATRPGATDAESGSAGP